METVQEEQVMQQLRVMAAVHYSRLVEERRESARKLRRLLFRGLIAYAVAVGLVVWFAMGVL